MGLPQRKYFSLDEYLLLEENASVKNELVDGEIFAMAGAKENHVKIVTNVVRNIANHLVESPCDIFSTDMKLEAGFDCYYPDVFVKCDPEDDNDLKKKTAIIIFEILSDSTENFDKGTKLKNYFQIESLQEYVLVSQKKIEVWIYKKNKKKWFLEIFNEGILHFSSIDLKISIEDFYAKIKF